jgi:sugar lactone lactonase YvrE
MNRCPGFIRAGPCQKGGSQVPSFIGSIRLCATLLYRFLAAAVVLALGAALHAQTAQAHFSGGQNTVPTSKLVYPGGVAVDARDNLYIADTGNGRVLKETPLGSLYTESTIADRAGYVLESPRGVAVDAGGNVYISDIGNDYVLKETLAYGGYHVSTIAGPETGLYFPFSVAVDATGNIFIADYDHNRIVMETPFANRYSQSIVPSSHLALPNGVAVDASGNVYIADTYNHRVLKETRLATTWAETTVVDLSTSSKKLPFGITLDAVGDIYIAAYEDVDPNTDSQSSDVLKETLAGDSYAQSTVASSGADEPAGIAVDASGNVYLADTQNFRILKLQQANVGFGGVNIGSTSAALSLIFTFDLAGTLGGTSVLTQGAVGLDFTDAGTGTCTTNGTHHIYAVGDICTIDVTFRPQFSGARYGAAVLQDAFGNPLATGYVYGTGLGPQSAFLPGTQLSIDSGLLGPSGLALDAAGAVYFAESGTGAVYKEVRSGGAWSRVLIAGGLSDPTGVAVDGAGNVYIAASNAVFKETLAHGSYSQSEIVSDLNDLVGIAVDGSGNLYLTASATGDVHKETLQSNGTYTETAIGSGITHPTGVAVDGSENIYIVDAGNGDVYKEMPQTNGTYIQTIVASGLTTPESVTVDGNRNLYITDPSQGEVDKETLQANGTYLATIAASGLNNPGWIALDGRGNLYLAQDTAKGDLAMIDVADPPPLSFAKTTVGSTSPDSPQLVTVSNIGNVALQFPVPGSGTNPGISTSFNLAGATTCPVVGSLGPAGSVDAGTSCIFAINFAPVASGPVSGSLQLTDNNLNAAAPNYAKQSIALRSGITSDETRTTLRVAPNPVTANHWVTLTATVIDTTFLATVPQGGGVVFTDTFGGKAVALNGGVPIPLSGGTAILNWIPGKAGTHTITSHYAGVDGSFIGSTGQAALTAHP